ncbi:MAG: class I SAM-dependent methyltransferase [Candidatus Methylacidiphilales bacterium]|nr:class I SAM-dependent methyltransferase [Candidatus Methylacidiphilales bacterium]
MSSKPLHTHAAPSNAHTEEVLDRESNFHDEWAASTPLDQIQVVASFEAPTAQENQFILQHMGDIRGKRILEIGSGLGESAVYFAMKGAQVTATDISPGMIERALELAKFHNVTIEGRAQPAERLDVPESYYDFVYVANTFHHVTDKEHLFAEVRRALKPGGRFYAWDPLAYNPVINVYRSMATKVRTIDEQPLTFADVETAKKFFSDVEHREFWISTLTLFLKYYMIDRLHPNDCRYWKQILKEDDDRLWWWHPLLSLDKVLTRLPLVRRLAWNMVMYGTRKD